MTLSNTFLFFAVKANGQRQLAGGRSTSQLTLAVRHRQVPLTVIVELQFSAHSCE
jgi:hypothetical protein